MTGFLASVTSVDEAALVLDAADIIDLKNPLQGALGALPHGVVEDIVRFVDGRKPVSATVGDLPMEPEVLKSAVIAMSRTGVDIVKIGFFGTQGHLECIESLRQLSGQCKLVAVLFADCQPEFSLLKRLAAAGFYGAMLDTADKSSGSLGQHLDQAALMRFLGTARDCRLLTGLAGSLRQQEISDLAQLAPDYLGFRGALCPEGQRNSALEKMRVQEVASVLRGCNTQGVLGSLQLQS